MMWCRCYTHRAVSARSRRQNLFRSPLSQERRNNERVRTATSRLASSVSLDDEISSPGIGRGCVAVSMFRVSPELRAPGARQIRKTVKRTAERALHRLDETASTCPLNMSKGRPEEERRAQGDRRGSIVLKTPAEAERSPGRTARGPHAVPLGYRPDNPGPRNVRRRCGKRSTTPTAPTWFRRPPQEDRLVRARPIDDPAARKTSTGGRRPRKSSHRRLRAGYTIARATSVMPEARADAR